MNKLELAKEIERICEEKGISIKEGIAIIEKHYRNYRYLQNIFTTKQPKGTDLHKLIRKLTEEQNEVRKAYYVADKENLIEELLDVIQMCVNTLDFLNVNYKQAIIEHNLKLTNRGWKFGKKVFRTF